MNIRDVPVIRNHTNKLNYVVFENDTHNHRYSLSTPHNQGTKTFENIFENLGTDVAYKTSQTLKN